MRLDTGGWLTRIFNLCMTCSQGPPVFFSSSNYSFLLGCAHHHMAWGNISCHGRMAGRKREAGEKEVLGSPKTFSIPLSFLLFIRLWNSGKASTWATKWSFIISSKQRVFSFFQTKKLQWRVLWIQSEDKKTPRRETKEAFLLGLSLVRSMCYQNLSPHLFWNYDQFLAHVTCQPHLTMPSFLWGFLATRSPSFSIHFPPV